MRFKQSSNKSTSEFDNPINVPILTHKPGVGVREYPSKSKLQAAGEELKENPPAILKSNARKFGRTRQRQQRTAILLAKARKAR